MFIKKGSKFKFFFINVNWSKLIFVSSTRLLNLNFLSIVNEKLFVELNSIFLISELSNKFPNIGSKSLPSNF